MIGVGRLRHRATDVEAGTFQHLAPRRRREPEPGEELTVGDRPEGRIRSHDDDRPSRPDLGLRARGEIDEFRGTPGLHERTEHESGECVAFHVREMLDRIARSRIEPFAHPLEHRLDALVDRMDLVPGRGEGTLDLDSTLAEDCDRPSRAGQMRDDRRGDLRRRSSHRIGELDPLLVRAGEALEAAEASIEAAQEAGLDVVEGVELIREVPVVPVGALADGGLDLADSSAITDRHVDVDHGQLLGAVHEQLVGVSGGAGRGDRLPGPGDVALESFERRVATPEDFGFGRDLGLETLDMGGGIDVGHGHKLAPVGLGPVPLIGGSGSLPWRTVMAQIIVTPRPACADLETSSLVRSLRRQTDDRWRLRKAGDPIGTESEDAVWVSIDPRSELREDAVAIILRAADTAPDADGFYTDLRVDGQVSLRAAWSPTRAFTEPSACQPIFVRGAAMSNDARADPTAAALELAESRRTVVHIPSALISVPPEPDVDDRRELLDRHLHRVGIDGRAVAGPTAGTYEIDPGRAARPTITVIIPTAGARTTTGDRYLDTCLAGLDGLEWPDLRILLVVGEEFDGDPDQLAEGPDRRIVRRPPGPFDFAAAANQGILEAGTDLVLLLNDDTEATDPTWLARMASHFGDPTVAVVGALLTYPDGSIQHAGVVLDDARPLHPFVGWDPEDLTGPAAHVAHDVIAVTGACLLARREVLLAAGGFSTTLPLSFNDIDVCLKLRRRGYRIVMEPGARLVHHETASREPHIDAWEWERFVGRWGHVDDPWYHPGFHRPDDPDALNRNADHLPPNEPIDILDPRDTGIHPKVHHARIPARAGTHAEEPRR